METARLQADLNTTRNKLRQSEREVKSCMKEKQEALNVVEAFDKQLREARQEAIRDQNLVA